MRRLQKKICRRAWIFFFISIAPNLECNFLKRRTRFSMDERLVANAKPACFKGKIRMEIKATFAPRQIKAIFRGVQVSCSE